MHELRPRAAGPAPPSDRPRSLKRQQAKPNPPPASPETETKTPQPPDPSSDPQAREAATLVARKRLQLGHVGDYDAALPALKARVREAEGQDMREAIQDKVRAGAGAGAGRDGA